VYQYDQLEYDTSDTRNGTGCHALRGEDKHATYNNLSTSMRAAAPGLLQPHTVQFSTRRTGWCLATWLDDGAVDQLVVFNGRRSASSMMRRSRLDDQWYRPNSKGMAAPDRLRVLGCTSASLGLVRLRRCGARRGAVDTREGEARRPAPLS